MRPFADKRPIGPVSQLGLPRSEDGEDWPYRPPNKNEVEEIIEYHIEELGFNPEPARRHIDEEFLVVLDGFVPDDTDSYQGKVAFALADHIHDWAIYYWPDGRVDILASSGSTL